MTRTVHFYHDFAPAMAGSYSTLSKFLTAFSERDFSSHVVSFDAEEQIRGECEWEPQCSRVPARRDYFSNYYRYVPAGRLEEARRQCAEADVIFTHLLYRHHCVVAAECARRFGKPLIIVPHGGLDPYCLTYRRLAKTLWLKHYDEALIRRGHFIFASDNEAAKAQQTVGPVTSHVVHWPCALVQSVPRAQAAYPDEVQPLRLLLVGRLHPVKRVIETVRAMAATRPGSCTLRLVGYASPEIPGEAVMRVASTLPPGTVAYDGPLAGERLTQAYLDSHGLVLFSHKENFGNVVAEAMSCGRPVFISEGVDLAPLVRKHRAGMVFPIRNDADVAAALAKISSLPRSQLEAMGRNGRTAAECEFGFPKFCGRVQSLVYELVRRPLAHSWN